jgi:hypothetical protein
MTEKQFNCGIVTSSDILISRSHHLPNRQMTATKVTTQATAN